MNRQDDDQRERQLLVAVSSWLQSRFPEYAFSPRLQDFPRRLNYLGLSLPDPAIPRPALLSDLVSNHYSILHPTTTSLLSNSTLESTLTPNNTLYRWKRSLQIQPATFKKDSFVLGILLIFFYIQAWLSGT